VVDPLTGPARDRRRDVVGSLGTALRELVDAAVRTEADEAELAAVEAVVREQAARLRAVSRELTAIAAVDDPEVGERWYSPVYGPGNPLAPPLHVVDAAAGRVTGRVTLGKAYEGPPGLVHGGYVISAFDDLLGVAQAASGIAGFTGTLSVRLHAGTPLNKRIDYEAGVGSHEGRKVVAWGKAWCDGQLLAEAEGIFIEPRDGHPGKAIRAQVEAAP
jgi:acyl-coenzyme A thioesterase PaaI-like protein